MAAAPDPPEAPPPGVDVEVELSPNKVVLKFKCTTGALALIGITGLSLGALYGKEATKAIIEKICNSVFGFCRTMIGSLLVDVECSTVKRVNQLLEDYRCGKLKKRFFEEVHKIGGKVDDLKIEFDVSETLKLNRSHLRHFEHEEKQSQKEDIPSSGMSKQEFREVLESIEKLKGVKERNIDMLSEYRMGKYPSFKSILRASTISYDKYGRTLLHYATRFGHKAVRQCIMSGLNINSLDCDGRTALHLMCIPHDPISHLFEAISSQNDTEFEMENVCEILIHHGIDINAKDSEGRTALHYAAMYDQQFIYSLISRNADTYAIDGNGKTPLDYAFEKSNTKAIGVLAGQFAKRGTEKEKRFMMEDVNKVDKDGKTILHHAAEVLNIAVIKGILDVGVSANILDKKGKSALDYAFERKNLQSAVTLLASVLEDKDSKKLAFLHLDQKEYLTMVDSRGRTILHYAAQRGSEKLFDLLTENSKILNEIDGEGKSALHYAAESNHLTAAEKLIKAGARVEQKDKDGMTVLHYVVRRGYRKLFDLVLRNKAILDELDGNEKSALHYALEDALRTSNTYFALKLIEIGAKVPLVKDNQGRTLLHNVIINNKLDDIDILIKFNVYINDLDDDGNSALHHAVNSGNIDAVNKLLEAGAEIDVKNQNSFTPLHRAVMLRFDAITDLLLTHNANPMVEDYTGRTALKYALDSHRNPEIIKKMEEGIAQLELAESLNE